jgi:hypothetical protein
MDCEPADRPAAPHMHMDMDMAPQPDSSIEASSEASRLHVPLLLPAWVPGSCCFFSLIKNDYMFTLRYATCCMLRAVCCVLIAARRAPGAAWYGSNGGLAP